MNHVIHIKVRNVSKNPAADPWWVASYDPLFICAEGSFDKEVAVRRAQSMALRHQATLLECGAFKAIEGITFVVEEG